MTAEVFKSMTGLTAQIVPFKTTPAVIGALRSNEVQAIFEFLTPALPHIKNGALRAFGVTTERRYPGLPDVPTLAEAGIPGYEASTWGAAAMPANTPRPIIDRMNREISAALATPTVKQRLQDLGIDPRGSTPEGLRELLIADIAKWKAIVEKANIVRQ